MKRCYPALACLLALLVSACASQPVPLQGEFVPISARDATDGDRTGARVRWGGQLIRLQPGTDHTCFEMMAARLDAYGRPWWSGQETGGRFIACRRGFYDPAIFVRGREVSFAGVIGGYETRRVGAYDYRFPRVDADVVYLWPVHYADPLTRPPPWPWWGYW